MLGGPPPREQLKRELKAWEKSFFASEGRAPEPKDLQAHPEVKAKYRLYERLKRDSHVGESSSKELGAKESRVGLPPPPPAVEEPKSDEVIAATPTAPRTSTFILGTPVPVNHENLIHDDGGAGTPTLSPIQPNRPHQPSNSIHPQPPVNPQARNSVFGSHLNKSSTSGDTWTRKGKAWDIDITEQLIQPSDKKSGFVNGTTSKDRIRDSKRNPLSERPSESSFEEPNPFAERRNPFSERTRKPLAELGMHSTAADDAEMHGMEVDDENMDSGHAIR